MQIKSRADLIEVRRQLRRSMTPAENLIWARLRNKQLGYRFLRQYSIGYYIIDFYCPKLHVAIEVDGGHHKENDVRDYDAVRDVYLKDLGVTLIRFWNDDVLHKMPMVISKIISAFPSTEGKVGKGF